MKKMIVAASILLAACSQQSDNDAKPAPRAPGVLGGVVADNLIRNADVTVYRLGEDGKSKEILQTTKTDAKGNYKQSIKVADTYVKLCAENGSYTEEASGVEIKMQEGQKLCAVAYYQSGRTHDVMITPETNMASALVECKASSSNDSINNIVSDANTRIGTLFGYNILTTKPADILDSEAKLLTLNDNTMSSMWHAAYSKLSLKIAKANGLSNHTQSISSIAIHQAMYSDIKNDCKLDGKDGTKKLAFGTFILTSEVYRTELARSLANFVQSKNNVTKVKLSDVVLNAQQFSQSTDDIYPANDIPTLFDNEPPQLSVEYDSGKYISGVFELKVNVSDFSGIESISIIINKEKYDGVLNKNESVFYVNTKKYDDGNINIDIIAVDKLRNEKRIKRNYIVSNKTPQFELTSKELSNNKDYQFSVKYKNLEAGIKSASLNGKEISFDKEKIFATLSLEEKKQILDLVVVDKSDRSWPLRYEISIDSQAPILDLNMPTDWTTKFKTDSDQIKEMSITSGLAANNYFWVPTSRRSLGFTSSSYQSLFYSKWATLVYSVRDPIRGSVSTAISDLKAKVSFIRGNAVEEKTIFSRELKIDKDGRIIIPLASEYVGNDWFKDDPVFNRNYLKLEVEDKAGNIAIDKKPIRVVSSSPKVRLKLPNGYLNPSNNTILFVGNEVSKSDKVFASFNGRGYVPIDLDKGIDINSVYVKDGDNYVVIKIAQGDEIIEKKYEFKMDRISPALNLESKQYTNNKNYIIRGLAADPISGVKSVTINGEVADFSNNSYAHRINLSKKINTVEIIATDNAGNKSKISKKIYYDNEKPKLFEYGKFDPYQVKYWNKDTQNHVVGDLVWNSNTPFLIEEQNLTIGDDDLSSSPHNPFTNTKVPYLFFSFNFYDGNKHAAFDKDIPEGITKWSQLKRSYSLKLGNRYLFENRTLSIGSSTYTRLPITVEYMNSDDGTPFYINPNNEKYELTVKAVDLAGNAQEKTVSFYIHVKPKAPNVQYLTESFDNISLDFIPKNGGKILAKYKIRNTSKYPIKIIIKPETEIIGFDFQNIKARKYNEYKKITTDYYLIVDDSWAGLSDDSLDDASSTPKYKQYYSDLLAKGVKHIISIKDSDGMTYSAAKKALELGEDGIPEPEYKYKGWMKNLVHYKNGKKIITNSDNNRAVLKKHHGILVNEYETKDISSEIYGDILNTYESRTIKHKGNNIIIKTRNINNLSGDRYAQTNLRISDRYGIKYKYSFDIVRHAFTFQYMDDQSYTATSTGMITSECTNRWGNENGLQRYGGCNYASTVISEGKILRKRITEYKLIKPNAHSATYGWDLDSSRENRNLAGQSSFTFLDNNSQIELKPGETIIIDKKHSLNNEIAMRMCNKNYEGYDEHQCINTGKFKINNKIQINYSLLENPTYTTETHGEKEYLHLQNKNSFLYGNIEDA